MSKEEKAKLSNITTVAAIATIVAAVVTILGFLFTLKEDKKELSLQIIAIDKLIYVSKLPNLKAYFLYNEKKIDDLASLKFKITNSGTITIVGDGPKKDLIGKGINLVVPDYLKILDYKVDDNSLNAFVEVTEKRRITIKFSQWRTSESITLTLYLSGNKKENYEPKVYTEDRDIIDGNIIIEDKKSFEMRKFRYIDRLISRESIEVGKIIGYFSLILIYIFPILLLLESIKDMYRLVKWKKNNFVKFSKYVEDTKTILPNEKIKIIKNPRELSKENWKNFDGEPFPGTSIAEDKRTAISIFSVCLFIVFISLPIFLIAIFYL